MPVRRNRPERPNSLPPRALPSQLLLLMLLWWHRVRPWWPPRQLSGLSTRLGR
jgi:hypothetical protein